MLLSFDVDAEALDEHDRWHTQEHLPERLSIPGFHRGTRWVAIAGAPRYMVLYEVATLQTLVSQPYLARLDNPTPWTTRIMSHYRGMIRGLCTVVGSFGHGQGATSALIRFAPPQPAGEELFRWLLGEALPAVVQMPGLCSADLLHAPQAAAMTEEQRIRGRDRNVDCAIIVTGYDRDAVANCARTLEGQDGLPDRGAIDIATAIYGVRYSLVSRELRPSSRITTATGDPPPLR